MKKINFILLIIISQLLINCSKSDSNTATPSSSDPKFSCKLNNDNYEGANLNLGGCKWNIQTNTDGSHFYYIEIVCSKVGDNIQQIAKFHLNSESIATNQIVPSTTSQFFISSGSTVYIVGQNTTGQIKITSFDGSKMSGEFSYVSLKNAINGSAPTANVSNGIFTNIPFHN